MASITWNPGINSYNPTVTLTVNQQSQSISNNTSTVAYSLVLNRPKPIQSSASKAYKVIINGSTVASGNTTIGGSGSKTIASGTTTISHGSDGKKSISFSFTQVISITWSGRATGNASGSGSMTLTTIPRTSKPTLSTKTQTIGNAITINTNRASGSFTHTVTYSLGSSSGTIATGVGASTSWTLPNSLASQLTSSSRAGTIKVTTYNGSTNIGSETVSFTARLPAIGDFSLSHSSRNLGSSITIYTPRTGVNYTHTITYTLGNTSATITNKTTAANTSWTLPNSLGDQMATVTSRTGQIKITAYNGNYNAGSKTINLTYLVPSNSTFNPTATDLTTNISGSGRDKTIGKYVQSISKLDASFTGTARGGATVASRQIKVGNSTYSGSSITTPTLTSTGTITITAIVKDSRGRTDSTSKTITVEKYNSPSITKFRAARKSDASKADITRGGSWTTLNGDNPLTITIKMKQKTSTSWSSIYEGTGTTGTVEGTVTASGLDSSKSYDFELELKDTFNKKATSLISIGTSKVALSIRDDVGIGVGKVHERGALDVEGDIYSSGKVYTDKGINVPDNRDESLTPGELPGKAVSFDFKRNSAVGNPPARASGTYSHIMNVKAWSDSSGGHPTQVSFGDGIAIRQATGDDTWGPWRHLATKDDLSSHMTESAKKHIHSSGSNTNGRWIKYDDGTMVVSTPVLTKNVTVLSRKEDDLNGYYVDIDINFPQNFKEPPSISPSGRLQKLRDGSTVNSVFSGINNLTISNDKATIRAWSILVFDTVTYLTLTAVGVWK